MATLHRFFGHFPFVGFSTTALPRFPGQLVYRNYSRRLKGKRPKGEKESIDIEGILKSSTAKKESPATPNVSEVSNDSPGNEEIKKWQVSEDRTNLLKQGERRVAIIAVVTMLVGFVAVKSIVYVTEKRRKTKEATEQLAPYSMIATTETSSCMDLH